MRTGRFRYEDGLGRAARALLDLPAAARRRSSRRNDEIALGVLEAARARGLRVPEDLSVVGFDDTQVARLASPPLTTVRAAAARRWARSRCARRCGWRPASEVDSHHVELATELVVRSSTAPPAA